MWPDTQGSHEFMTIAFARERLGSFLLAPFTNMVIVFREFKMDQVIAYR